MENGPMNAISHAPCWIAASLLSTATALCQDNTHDWGVRQFDGMDFVPLTNVKQFYGFDIMERNGAEIILLNEKRLSSKFTVGSKACEFNKVKIILEQKIIEDNGEAYLSRGDLGRVIDPLLRPDKIKGTQDFQWVILDPYSVPGSSSNDEAAEKASLSITEQTKAQLEKIGRRVLVISGEAKTQSIKERVESTSLAGETAIYINITFEQDKDKPRGIWTAVYQPPIQALEEHGEENSQVNLALGVAIHGMILWHLGPQAMDNGIEGVRSSAFFGISHPAITIRLGNLADEYDTRLAENEKFQAAMARAISHGAMKFRNIVAKKKD